MKNIYLSFILILSHFLSFSQDQPYKFSKVIQLEGISKDDIYTKSLLWCSKIFVNSNYVLRVKERMDGLIAGKFIFNVSYKFENEKGRIVAGSVDFQYFESDWAIEIKEGKLRFSTELSVLKGYNNPNDLHKSFRVESKVTPPYFPYFISKNAATIDWGYTMEAVESKLNEYLNLLENEIKTKDEW